MDVNSQDVFAEKDEDTPEEELENPVEFTKAMRMATRKVHNMSDALVNAKLSIGKCILIMADSTRVF